MIFEEALNALQTVGIAGVKLPHHELCSSEVRVHRLVQELATLTMEPFQMISELGELNGIVREGLP